MNPTGLTGAIEILMVEDNPGDARLTMEGFKGAAVAHNLSVVEDGVEAMAHLHREGKYADARRPDLILLDINLPRMDGREVLSAIKSDDDLRRIPVVVLTTSDAEEDILRMYNLHANCYLTKPLDLEKFIEVVRSIEHFWLNVAKLPPR